MCNGICPPLFTRLYRFTKEINTNSELVLLQTPLPLLLDSAQVTNLLE